MAEFFSLAFVPESGMSLPGPSAILIPGCGGSILKGWLTSFQRLEKSLFTSPWTWMCWTPPPFRAGTPEAGGVGFLQLLDAIIAVCTGANVIGCDITELSPPLDASGCSTATACKVLRETVLCLAKKLDSYQREV
jgi:hypothetical protein